MALKFCTGVAKESKLKVGKFWGLIPTFKEVTGGNWQGWGLVVGLFAPLFPKPHPEQGFLTQYPFDFKTIWTGDIKHGTLIELCLQWVCKKEAVGEKENTVNVNCSKEKHFLCNSNLQTFLGWYV